MTPNTFTELLKLLKVYLEPIDRNLTVEEIQTLFHSTLAIDGQTVIAGRIAIPGSTDYDGTEIALSAGWGTAPVVTLTDSNVLADSRTALTNLGLAQLTGSVTAATIDTSTNKTLKIKSNPAASFTSIVVTSGAATPMATVASDIQTAADVAGLQLVVAVDGVSGKLVIASETGYVEIDTVAHGSTLSTAAGFATGGVFCEVAAVNDTAGRILVVADTVTAANPTISVTFKDGPFATVPRGYVRLADTDDDMTIPIKWYATRSGFVATYVGTPTATTKTYKLEWFFHT